MGNQPMQGYLPQSGSPEASCPPLVDHSLEASCLPQAGCSPQADHPPQPSHPPQAGGYTPKASQPPQASGYTPKASQPQQASGYTPKASQSPQAGGHTPNAGQQPQAAGFPPQDGYTSQARQPVQAGFVGHPPHSGVSPRAASPRVGRSLLAGRPQHTVTTTERSSAISITTHASNFLQSAFSAVSSALSPIACPSCQGKGWRHDSSMGHDTPVDQRCFFCKSCPACGGRGVCGAPCMVMPVFGGGFASGMRSNACPSCQGKGWRHDSSMGHDKPVDQRCFFCKSCLACGGRGVCGAPSMAMPVFDGGFALGMRSSTCPSCQGKGWRHDSSMGHDKPVDQKCFFCKPCSGCNGEGVV